MDLTKDAKNYWDILVLPSFSFRHMIPLSVKAFSRVLTPDWIPRFSRVFEDMDPVLYPIPKNLANRVLAHTVLRCLIKKRGEHLVILTRFIRDLQPKDLGCLHIDHRINHDPTTPDFPFLTHPLSLVGDLNPLPVDSQYNVIREHLRNQFQ